MTTTVLLKGLVNSIKREVTINGVRIVASGKCWWTTVPSLMLSIEKVARMVELFTDPNGEDGIDATMHK